jgi:isoquinoline 1-oxidoreductase beta subunit
VEVVVTLARTDFLRIVAVAGAGWTLGLEVRTPALAAAATEGSALGWVRLSADGLVTVMVNKAEMGQGVTTSLPMLVAEELEVPLERVRFTFAPAAPQWCDPGRDAMSTGGSQSIKRMSPVMRHAGATAKAMLISAAANTWRVDAAACRARAGVVYGPAGQHADYRALLNVAAALPVPADVPLKTPDQFTLIGTRPRRLDILGKTNGRAVFGLDVRVPGMKFASIEKAPEIGGTVTSFDKAAAMRVPGVVGVYPVSTGVAVVADTTWAAFHARTLLRATFGHGPNAAATTTSMYAQMRELVQTPGGIVKSIGDARAALAHGPVVRAVYDVPYLAHAPMEPMNATAEVLPDRVTVWAPTQVPTLSQAVAAKIAGLPIAAVTVNSTLLGGGFGRRLAADYVADAVEVAKAAGVPIKVVWTREDDIRHDPYRPGSVNALAATLAADGTIDAYTHTLALSAIAARGDAANLDKGVDPGVVRGTGDMAYTIPNLLVDFHHLDVKIPVGPWRAPYANGNFFPTESFIDELAHAAGQDPVAFRLAMLPAGSRARGVLQIAAQRAKWGAAVPAGHARGVAVAQWDDTWIALIAEVSAPDGGLRAHRMWAAVDCGLPVNLDGIEQQVSGAILYGLSAALTGKITFTSGAADQSNFNNYTILHMRDAPSFDIAIVPSHAAPLGCGEIGTPPVAPALANAYFALTGKRVRSLPLLENLA